VRTYVAYGVDLRVEVVVDEVQWRSQQQVDVVYTPVYADRTLAESVPLVCALEQYGNGLDRLWEYQLTMGGSS
jgi:hypothetical protein